MGVPFIFGNSSGDKIKSVTVYANFKNLVTGAPSDRELSEALANNVCRYIKTQDVSCEASSGRLPPKPGAGSKSMASHLITLDAELFSRLTRGDRYWNPCQTNVNETQCEGGFDSAMKWNSCMYQVKKDQCIGGYDQYPDIPARMRMTVDVVEINRGKSVFKLDKPQVFDSSDENKWAASDEAASALLQGLKKAKLF